MIHISANKLDIVGICGSLRSGSLNRMLLNLASASLPEAAAMEVIEWRQLPVFDADAMAEACPPHVAILCDRIRKADGIVIASPEYNFSIPGGLKNAIDWISRTEDQPFAKKAVAIVSAATGPLGGARVQYDIRRVMLFLNAHVLTKPEVFVGSAASKFDAVTGLCTDEPTRKIVATQMMAFEKWIAAVKAMEAT